MGPNGSAGMLPEHFRTLLDHFWKNHFLDNKTTRIIKTFTGQKTVFLNNDRNEKDARRHDSHSDGPMTSPSSLWSLFVKKRVLISTRISIQGSMSSLWKHSDLSQPKTVNAPMRYAQPQREDALVCNQMVNLAFRQATIFASWCASRIHKCGKRTCARLEKFSRAALAQVELMLIQLSLLFEECE